MILEEWSTIITEREFTENDCVDQTDMGRLTLSKLYQDLTDLRGRMRDLEEGNQRLRRDLRECFSHQRSDIANLEKAVTATRGMYISDKEQHDALMQQVRHLKAKTDFLRSPNKAAMDLAFSAPALKVAPVPSTPTGQKVSSQYAAPPSSGSVVLLSEEQAQLERERYIAATMATTSAPAPVVHHHQHVQNSNGNVFLAGSFSGTTLTNSLMEAPKKPTAEESAAKKTEDFKRLLTGKSSNIGEDGKIHLHFFIKENRENGNLLFSGGLPFYDEHRPIHPSCQKNKAGQRYACEMIELVITPAERKRLGEIPGPRHPTTEDWAFYDDITRRVMDRLLEFEEKDPDVERQAKGKRPGRDPTTTILAIGKRVKKYKNIVKAARPDLADSAKKASRSFDPTPLIPGYREGGLPIGTPENNKSIARMFARKKNDNEEPPSKKARI